jgi:hypothetical protein
MQCIFDLIVNVLTNKRDHRMFSIFNIALLRGCQSIRRSRGDGVSTLDEDFGKSRLGSRMRYLMTATTEATRLDASGAINMGRLKHG